MDDLCILELCDPDGLELGDAVRLARRVSALDSAVAPHLRAFIEFQCGYEYPDPRVLERSLRLMQSISDTRSFARLWGQLERHENPQVQAVMRWLEVEEERKYVRWRAAAVAARG